MYMYVYVYRNVQMYLPVYVYVYVCVYVYVYADAYVTYLDMVVCIYACMYMHMYMCMGGRKICSTNAPDAYEIIGFGGVYGQTTYGFLAIHTTKPYYFVGIGGPGGFRPPKYIYIYIYIYVCAQVCVQDKCPTSVFQNF